jgi:hypothetical protein
LIREETRRNAKGRAFSETLSVNDILRTVMAALCPPKRIEQRIV